MPSIGGVFVPNTQVSGTLKALNDAVSTPTAGFTAVGVQVTGTYSGTIVPEISMDGGTTWNPTSFDLPATDETSTSLVGGATGSFVVNVAGASNMRVRLSLATSGSAAVVLNPTLGSCPHYGTKQAVSLVTQTAATTTFTSADIDNPDGKYIHVILDTTAVGSGSLTISIKGKDPASGKYYTLLAGAAVTTNTTNVYKVGPGLPVTSNVSANDILPRTLQILATANNSNPATYTIGYVISQ